MLYTPQVPHIPPRTAQALPGALYAQKLEREQREQAARQAARMDEERNKWITEFMVDFNPVAASLRLFPAMIPVEARRLGGKMLRHPKTQAVLKAQLQRKLEDQEVSPDRVLVELARIAFFDPLDLLDDQGELKPLSQIPAHARRAIAGLDVKVTPQGVTRSVRFHSKIEALGNLGKHLKLFGAEAAAKQDFSITFVNPPAQGALPQGVVDGQIVPPRQLPEPVKVVDVEGARKIQEALDSAEAEETGV